MVMKTSPRVLVVDDDAVVGRSFDRVLSQKGYAVSTALSGPEALNEIGQKDFDVVFTDIKMPEMDGFEVTKRIKEKCPWTPVVIVTGYGTAANEATAEVLGASGFVRKPLTPEMIEGITLKALLEKKTGKEPAKVPEATVEPSPEVAERSVWQTIGGITKNTALLLAAPFVGLVYAVSLPFVGLGLLVWFGGRAAARRFRAG
jgi:CheY-like chemotaxis protein